MSTEYGNRSIVTSGLTLCLDAGNLKSYPTSGTTWTDLSKNGYNGTLTNGPTFSSANCGSIVFDGVNDYVDFGNILNSVNTTSVNFWVKNPNGGVIITKGYRVWEIRIDTTVFGGYVGVSVPSYWEGIAARNVAHNVDVTNWNNFTYVFNYTTTNIQLYVNGISKGSINVNNMSSTYTPTFNLNIGRRVEFDNNQFSGIYLKYQSTIVFYQPQKYYKTITQPNGDFNNMSYNTFTPIVTNGLVLYLDAANTKSYVSGSTTWNDLSKNGNNGTLVNGPTFDSNNSGGIVFDGSTQYVTNIGTTNTFSFIQNTAIFTIDTWVKPSVLGTAMYFIGNNDGTTNAKGFFVGKNATERIIVTVTYGTGAQYVIYIVTPYFTDTNWVNVIITSNGINAIAYKNASPVGSPTSVGSTLSTGDSTSTLAVGRVNNLAGTNWSGNIASTKIYNRALSAQEVLQNYNATKFRFQ